MRRATWRIELESQARCLFKIVKLKTRKLLAEHICGEESELLQVILSLPRAALQPPDPILRFAVRRRIGRIASAGPDER